MKHMVRNFIKKIVFLTPFARLICFRYRYNFLPSQLAFLVECIDKTAKVPGAVVEIGCFEGGTTVYLNKHMNYIGIDKPYVAIDTFSGFIESHIKYEVEQRGKARELIRQGFSSNSKKWFEKTMKINQIDRVTCIETDAASYDYAGLAPISFVLIDVDLYQPVKEVLKRVWPLLSENGIIVVDDCVERQCFDGALEAYNEFMENHQLAPIIVQTKLGVISKQ